MLAIALCPHPRQDIHSHGGRDISPRCLPSPCAPHPRSTFRLSTIERSDRLKCRGDACHRPVPSSSPGHTLTRRSRYVWAMLAIALCPHPIALCSFHVSLALLVVHKPPGP